MYIRTFCAIIILGALFKSWMECEIKHDHLDHPRKKACNDRTLQELLSSMAVNKTTMVNVLCIMRHRILTDICSSHSLTFNQFIAAIIVM
jgi:hypothetical protein